MFKEHLDQAQKSYAEGSHETALRFLRDALKLWRGPCLSGIPGPFAEFERHRLGELHLVALEPHAELLLLLGHPQDAAARLVTLTAEHPLRERFRELRRPLDDRSRGSAPGCRAQPQESPTAAPRVASCLPCPPPDPADVLLG
ncbi:BTAD domain-containing putative transcriptional regulator [Streptosporangium vulgare]|uniref:BTAD domain-containing putative transcriptional regulator n=1 Tax=Streptosporangium vulgare TaxID=46190 RepID=A0ABV5T4N9_9ACTN